MHDKWDGGYKHDMKECGESCALCAANWITEKRLSFDVIWMAKAESTDERGVCGLTGQTPPYHRRADFND